MDVGVRTAPADVAAHALPDLGVRNFGRARKVRAHVAWNTGLDLLEHRHRRADLPGRAEAALIAIVLHERHLHWMQVARCAETLNRCHIVALVHYGESEA